MPTSTIDIRLIPTVQYVTPTTGSTINASTLGNVSLLINPTGSLLALTLALNASPSDGDKISIASSQVVTGFTMTGGTVIGALTSLAIASFATYEYSATANQWFRIG
jgi:hypothetical protein